MEDLHIYIHVEDSSARRILKRMKKLERLILMTSANLAAAIAALQAQETLEDNAVVTGIQAESDALTRMEADLATLRAAIPPDNTAAIAAIDSISAALATHTTNLTAISAQAAAADPAASTGTGTGTGTGTSPSDTTVSLATSVASVASGQPVGLTAKVSGVSGAPTPTGTVTFLDGTNTLGTGDLDSTGTASFTVTGFAPGAHSITASYPGDTANAAAVSSAVAVTAT